MATRLRIAVALLCLLVLTRPGGGGVLPSPTPVESPFPAEGGPWLLLAAEADELGGELVLIEAEAIRNAVPDNRRAFDYDTTDELSDPWRAALTWAQERGSGSVYFVFRDGSRAAEGRLEGGLQGRLDALTRAMGGE